MYKLLFICLALATLCVQADDSETPDVAHGLPLLFESDFDKDDLSRWTFTDRVAWKIADSSGRRVLEQFKASNYEPKVRSPLNIALFPEVDASDFVLDLWVRSTARDYGHRDVCLFFGYQDPTHFYYVHLGKQADDHAHSVFLVNNAPRVSIARERTQGTPWTDGWHHVRIVRTVESGEITVYFDDMRQPIMRATDRTFLHGRLGVGSFDDTAQFDRIRLWGRAHK